MKLVALMPVRNEDWILGLSARVALMWCDAIVIGNHCSTDGTTEIIDQLSSEYPGRVHVRGIPGEGWSEMEHRQALLQSCRSVSATHIALVDADEILTGDSLPHVRRYAEALMPGECLNVAMHCMWRDKDHYRSDAGSVWSNRRDLALVVADSPSLCWAAGAGGYQHHSRAPHGSTRVLSGTSKHPPQLGAMHMQFADWGRLKAKHALYKVRERVSYPHKTTVEIDQMYNQALDERNLQATVAPDAWWDPYRHLLPYLRLGNEPWQAEETRRLYRKHGPDMFRGLDLFGIV